MQRDSYETAQERRPNCLSDKINESNEGQRLQITGTVSNRTHQFIQKWVGVIRANYESGDLLIAVIVILAGITFSMERYRSTELPVEISILDLIRGGQNSPYQPRWLTWFTIGKAAILLVGEHEKLVKKVFCVFDTALFFATISIFFSISKRLFTNKILVIVSITWLVAGIFLQYASEENLNVYQPYDMPAVFISVVSLYIVFCRPDLGWALAPIIAIGAFNRETTLLLVPLIYFLSRGSLAKIAWVSASLLLWLAAYLISRKFIAPMDVAWWASFYEDNRLRPIASFYRMSHDINALITFLMAFAYAYAPVLLYFNRLKGTIFAILWPSIALGFGIFFLVGNLEEIRLYSELLPMMVLQGSAIVFSLFANYDLPSKLRTAPASNRNGADLSPNPKFAIDEGA